MFYLSSLTKEICIYPKDLTSDIKSLIASKIRELEGSVVGNYGYVISIIEFNQTSKGKVDNETGRVNYKIMYKAITFKPNVGEILNTIPIFINEHGFFCKVGHLKIFISQHMMKDWEYNSEENTWDKKTVEKKIIKRKVKTESKSKSKSESKSESESEPESESESEPESESESESESKPNPESESEPESESKPTILLNIPSRIKIGEILRVKIIAFRIDSNEITGLAEIN
jgi:DNA-directed RNA polymerase II subunit RPB7